MRHRRHPINSTSAARRTAWARFEQNVSNAAAATYSAVDLLANYKLDGGTSAGCTVTRIHLEMAVTSVITVADKFAWGILRGQDTDVGVNNVGTPQAVAHPYEDWMFWQYPAASSNTGAGPAYWQSASNVLSLDLKAQRKIPELQQTLLLIVGPQVVTTLPLTVHISGSVLLKLP